VVNACHGPGTQGAEVSNQSTPVNCPNLVEQNHGLLGQAPLAGRDQDLKRIERRLYLGADRSDDGRASSAVPDVILNDNGRSRLLDLGPDGWVEGDEIHLSPTGEGYFRPGRRRSACSHVCSSTATHSSTILRSRAEREAYPSSSCLRSLPFPTEATRSRIASLMKRLRAPFVVTRSSRLTVSRGSVMLRRS
jgi:hypothetical protein